MDSRVRGLGDRLLALSRAVQARLRGGTADILAGLRGHRLREPADLCPGRPDQPAPGPAAALAGALAARVVLLAALAGLAAAGQVPVALPLAAFSGVLFAWSFLSVASPGLTAQLVPQAEGEAQGILAASSGIAGFGGSVAGGFAAARYGYPAALGIGAGATAVGLIIFTATLQRPSRRLPVPPDARPLRPAPAAG